MLLTRSRPSLYIPFWAAVWSVLSATTAAVHNYQQLIVLRFFLGIVESPFFPGASKFIADRTDTRPNTNFHPSVPPQLLVST